MADEQEDGATERTLVLVRLKKKVVESPNKAKVTVNGEEFKLSSDSVTEVPDFVLDHLGTEYEIVDEDGKVIPPDEALEVDEKTGKRKPKRRAKRSSR